MQARSTLAQMCRDIGLPDAYAAHLIPAVQKALELPPAQRDMMLALVAQSLQQRADGLADEEAKYAHLDRELLHAAARVLHPWTPASNLLAVGESLQRWQEGQG